MSSNVDKFRKEVAGLVQAGEFLLHAMQLEQFPEEAKTQLDRLLKDAAPAYIKSLPQFRMQYQIWYSESKALIRQVIPDRLQDFCRHYERQSGRKRITWENYTIEDYLQQLSTGLVTMVAGVARMEQQLGILRSAQKRFESSLFDIKRLVAADFLDSEIDEARELLRRKFFRAAGAVAGVVLEKHLAQVCESRSIKFTKKHPTIADFNDLLKNGDVIDMPSWRFNQHLADIRNLCDHNKDKDPTESQVEDLIDGVSKVLKTIF